jgi:two-component system C4-dicarboxylate transport response regulator DctD
VPEITVDRRSHRVLIVEDAGHVRSMLCDLLAAWGWQADGVLNASEALERLERCRYDLLLTDFRMPGMTGIELVERVRARDADLPVIMLTASSVDLDLACRRLRITLLRKPLEIARLKSVLPRMQDVPADTSSVGAALSAGFDAR